MISRTLSLLLLSGLTLSILSAPAAKKPVPKKPALRVSSMLLTGASVKPLSGMKFSALVDRRGKTLGVVGPRGDFYRVTPSVAKAVKITTADGAQHAAVVLSGDAKASKWRRDMTQFFGFQY